MRTRKYVYLVQMGDAFPEVEDQVTRAFSTAAKAVRFAVSETRKSDEPLIWHRYTAKKVSATPAAIKYAIEALSMGADIFVHVPRYEKSVFHLDRFPLR